MTDTTNRAPVSLDDWLDYISRQHVKTIDMGLQRMHEMVARMSLQRPAKQILTVAGTNGKGSTCIAAEVILRGQGLRVGTTLSPHIRRFNERIRLFGDEANNADICAAFNAVDAQRGELNLTYFEYATLAALWLFKRARLDVAILEIGLGGRLDAFNVVDADIAVITSIGLDHQSFLGDTLDAIGAEKAGILRPSQTVVLGPDMPTSVLDACAELDLAPIQYGVDFKVEVLRSDVWNYKPLSSVITNQLVGKQVRSDTLADDGQALDSITIQSIASQNIAVAATACAFLGVPIHRLSEIGEVDLLGRLTARQCARRQWLMDVAHNPAGVGFLIEVLRQRNLDPSLIICGMLRDKDHAEVCELVSAFSNAKWVLISTEGERGMLDTELAQRADLAADKLHFAGSSLSENRTLRRADGLSDGRRVGTYSGGRPDSGKGQLFTWILSETDPGDVILAFGSFNLVEQCEGWLNSVDDRLGTDAG